MENILYGLIMMASGVICFLISLKTMKTANVSKKWPTVDGVIVSSGTKRMSTLGDGPATAADVKYTYTVGVIEYTSDRISLGQYGTGGGGHAQAEADRYPVDKAVTVHYDPKSPASAVLEPGGAVFLSLFLMFFAAIMAPCGLLFLLAGIVKLFD